MKGYYICFGELGINLRKKVGMQMEELGKYSDISLVTVKKKRISAAGKFLYRVPFSTVSLWDYKTAMAKMQAPDYIYIRRSIADSAYIDFLKAVRTKYHECTILVEVFTYPYDRDEFSHWKMWWPYYVRECINRKKYQRYIDKFVTYSDDSMIFNVPTIRTFNGICVEDYPIKHKKAKQGEIRLLAVAMFRKHHGYERIIKGLAEYYKGKPNIKVILHMVGDGPERQNYQDMSESLGLQDVVVFEGLLDGEKLDKVYDLADIALGAFAMYKNNLMLSSALKIREYLARGIPVISGCKEDAMSGKEIPFFKEYPNDGSTIEINSIVEFYETNIDGNADCSPEKIRLFAKQTVSMENAMWPVISVLQNQKNQAL